jgi:hypothetical protein
MQTPTCALQRGNLHRAARACARSVATGARFPGLSTLSRPRHARNLRPRAADVLIAKTIQTKTIVTRIGVDGTSATHAGAGTGHRALARATSPPLRASYQRNHFDVCDLVSHDRVHPVPGLRPRDPRRACSCHRTGPERRSPSSSARRQRPAIRGCISTFMSPVPPSKRERPQGSYRSAPGESTGTAIRMTPTSSCWKTPKGICSALSTSASTIPSCRHHLIQKDTTGRESPGHSRCRTAVLRRTRLIRPEFVNRVVVRAVDRPGSCHWLPRGRRRAGADVCPLARPGLVAVSRARGGPSLDGGVATVSRGPGCRP